jgi:hypothetical protein
MDPIGNADHDIDHPMESSLSHAAEERSDSGSFELRNLKDEQRLNTPTPSHIANYRGPAAYPKPQGMDNPANISSLSGRAHGRSFVALPDVFDGRKENYRQFW